LIRLTGDGLHEGQADPQQFWKGNSEMTKTVIGTYSTLETALAVVNDLVNAGFHRNTISVIADDPDQKYAAYVDRDTSAEGTAAGAGIGAMIGGLGGLLLGLGALAIPGIGPVIAAGPIVSTLAGAGVGAVTGGIIGALADMGVPKESAEAYAESVRRGNALVAAQVPDNQAGEATRIMQRQGLVDIERQSQDWRSSGWKGFDANAAPLRRTTTNAPTNANTTRNTTVSNTRPTAGTFQVVEENLQVGKRAVETGGVRVRSNVQEVPVQEEVTLRQEHVEVERRPVDRPATAADLNSFKEGTLEVRETQERPVVSKEARVVEEVRVTKNVEQHTETVHDTVRRTDVDVEPMAGTARTTATGSTTFRPYETYDPDFRSNYQSTYSSLGSYDRFQPAYRYGYTLATDQRYAGRNWSDVEPEARKAWNSQNKNSWEDFKDAVQYSWDKVRGRI
jgi:uncharacterized protein (TIGR02271 family)